VALRLFNAYGSRQALSNPYRLSNLPEATAPAMMYALRSHWLELKGTGVCLTDEGRQLPIKQTN
jgi:hypothetical protein